MVYLPWRQGKPPCTVHIFIPTLLRPVFRGAFFCVRLIKTKPRFPSVFELSIKTISHKPRLPRGSAYAIQAAQQSDKNRGRVPRFLYFQREKSFCIGTFFRPCFAKSKHILSEKRQFFRQILRHRVIGASFGEGMAAADAPQRKPASLECAVLLNRLKGVL